MLIKDTIVLIVDCQATGANPEQGRLIEIGWMLSHPHQLATKSPIEPEVHLIQLPEGMEIPRQVQRVTGISTDDLKGAISIDRAWGKLITAADKIKGTNTTQRCPVIVHFAKYETPFLQYLHQRYAPHEPFPFDVICTHELVKRLMPELPRKGLRAVAGYFGFSTPEKRRCEHHLRATQVIWDRVTELLDQNHGIQTITDLKAWLASTEPMRNVGRVYPMERKLRLKLPDTSGIYRFKRVNGDLLYVGKAKNIKNRVNSYFQNGRRQPEHILEMLSQACDLNYTKTGSALEAALLESDEIKMYAPPYNIALKVRDRKLGFLSRGLNRQGVMPDLNLTVGPLPSQDLLSTLTVLEKLLAGNDLLPQDGSAIMAMPDTYMPEDSILSAGLAAFLDQYQQEPGSQPLLQHVARLGAIFWKRRMDEEAVDNPAEDSREEAGDSAEDKEWEWTKEAVVKTLEETVGRCAHLIRRARWFCLISESTLIWPNQNDKTLKDNMLIFSRGRILRRESLDSGISVQVPPGHRRSLLSRQMSFDLMTYDRMRVLTTEIRRLVSEERSVKLRLRPNTILENHALHEFLKWI